MKILFLSLLLAPTLASAADVFELPGAIERESYGAWLEEIGSVRSAYTDHLFDWLEEQKTAALPKEVAVDPEHLFVTVDRPLQQAIEAEANGDVERGVTYGLETYGVVDADVATTLETILFRWGKPVGAESGVTYPLDTVFGYREEKLTPVWGPGSYRSETTMKNGGVAKDQNDVSTLLVRGNPRDGYVIVGNFFGPKGKTPSTSSMSIILIRPTADGRTDYRVSGRYTGQSYLIFGIDFGRRNYGFNATRIRAGQKDFYANVAELKNTGKISERRPK